VSSNPLKKWQRLTREGGELALRKEAWLRKEIAAGRLTLINGRVVRRNR
jgi:hypothetical protein